MMKPWLLAIVLMFLVSCTPLLPKEKIVARENIMKLTSPAFAHDEKIPGKYTCDADNINPPLMISDTPLNAKSLVLIMDDPDIPEAAKKAYNIEVWDHWVVFNMPPTVTKIREKVQPPGTRGINTRKELGYKGPCPPDREHRYFFKLYALDTLLDLPEGATKTQVEQAMQGHVLETAELVGRYARKGMG